MTQQHPQHNDARWVVRSTHIEDARFPGLIIDPDHHAFTTRKVQKIVCQFDLIGYLANAESAPAEVWFDHDRVVLAPAPT